MTERDKIRLVKELEKLGFASITDEVKTNIKPENSNFTVVHSDKINDDSLLYELHFANHENKTRLAGYGLTMQSIVIPKIISSGIDATELEAKMIRADDLYNRYYIGKKGIIENENKIIEPGNRGLDTLYQSGGIAREAAQLIMFKYWPQQNYKEFIADDSRLKENYQAQITVEPDKGKMLSALEAYNEVKKIYHIPKIKGMREEHVISDGLFEQAQFEISFGREWIAYNTIPYFLDKGDVQFFKTKDEAHDFSSNKISEYDNYAVIKTTSIQDFLLQIPYGRLEENKLNNYSNKNLSIMNEKNYDYLKDQLKFTGFGEGLQNDLKEKMEIQTPEFQLNHSQKFGNDEVNATLHFKKSNDSDMYFFNKYDMALKNDAASEAVKQTFYINKESSITFKEGYNLMNGRAVNKDLTTKEGEKYNAWVQMDFKETDNNGNFKMKQYHQNYGYNIEQVLAKLPVKELATDTDKNALVQSLEKGNRQSITFVQDGKETRHFIEANPQFKSVTVYDGTMQRVNISQSQKESQGETADKSKKKDIKNKQPDEGGFSPVNGQKLKKKKGVSMS